MQPSGGGPVGGPARGLGRSGPGPFLGDQPIAGGGPRGERGGTKRKIWPVRRGGQAGWLCRVSVGTLPSVCGVFFGVGPDPEGSRPVRQVRSGRCLGGALREIQKSAGAENLCRAAGAAPPGGRIGCRPFVPGESRNPSSQSTDSSSQVYRVPGPQLFPALLRCRRNLVSFSYGAVKAEAMRGFWPREGRGPGLCSRSAQGMAVRRASGLGFVPPAVGSGTGWF